VKAKVTLSNYVSHSSDGAEWCLSPQRVEHDGKTLTEDDPGFREACVTLDLLHSVHVNHVDYCWDNFVDGVPDKTVTLGGVTLDVQELVGEASEDGPPYATQALEVDVPAGFSL